MMRLFREPLVQFGVLAVCLFVVFAMRNDVETQAVQTDQIIVADAEVLRLAATFEATWKRRPTAEETRRLVDAFVTEEVLVREALVLGLDEGDAVVRNRLRQKLLFLTESAAQLLDPDDDVLRTFMLGNQEQFLTLPQVSFEQVFVSEKPDETLMAETLDVLRAGADPQTVGARLMLPDALSNATPGIISRSFGADFYEQLAGLEIGGWNGPIRSGYGFHIVRVTQKSVPTVPSLDEIRDVVLRDWRSAQSELILQEQIKGMKERYAITVPTDEAIKVALQ